MDDTMKYSEMPNSSDLIYRQAAIDGDNLHKAMYHRAFETDGDTMWQSGCWVRYRAIEQVQDSQPTIIEAEEGEEHDRAISW